MNVRVNMLQEGEVRYYSAVSKSFAIKTGVISTVLGLTLMTVLFIFQVINVNRNLGSSREQWAEIEPRYIQYEAIQENVKGNRQLLNELEQWKNMRINWDSPLLSVQQKVPLSIQLKSIQVRSDFSVDIKRSKIGKGDEAIEIVKMSPSREFRLSIDGLAVDELADEVVIEFVNEINKDEHISDLFEKVQLTGLQRSSSDKEFERVFSLEATSIPLKGERPK